MSSLWSEIARSISNATAESFTLKERTPVGGGCINAAFRIKDAHRSFFVKTNTPESYDMFAAEAAGLAELGRAQALRVPRPICDGRSAEASWLVLEFIELGASANKRDARALGRGLAAQHRVTAEKFGWTRDNTIGSTPQVNSQRESWTEFWRDCRLGYQLDLASQRGAPKTMLAKGERLRGDFGVFLEDRNVLPTLLHGDLWGGNAAFDPAGAPIVFDPAVYYGHHEADLAMTELFGGFSAEFYTAYRDAYPLEAGYPVRRDLYNLYHILNHYNLFGGSYARQAEAMIDRLLAEL